MRSYIIIRIHSLEVLKKGGMSNVFSFYQRNKNELLKGFLVEVPPIREENLLTIGITNDVLIYL